MRSAAHSRVLYMHWMCLLGTQRAAAAAAGVCIPYRKIELIPSLCQYWYLNRCCRWWQKEPAPALRHVRMTLSQWQFGWVERRAKSHIAIHNEGPHLRQRKGEREKDLECVLNALGGCELIELIRYPKIIGASGIVLHFGSVCLQLLAKTISLILA